MSNFEKHIKTFLNHAGRFGEHLADFRSAYPSVTRMWKAQTKAEWHLVRARNALDRTQRSWRGEVPVGTMRRLEDGLERMVQKYQRVRKKYAY